MMNLQEDPFRFHRFLKLGIWCYKLTDRAANYVLSSFRKAGFLPERISSKDSLYQLKSYDCIIGFHGPLEVGEEKDLTKKMKAMHRYPLPLIALSALKGCLNDQDVLELKKIVFRVSLLEKVTLLSYKMDGAGNYDGVQNQAYLRKLADQLGQAGFRVENEAELTAKDAFDAAKIKRLWTASLVFAFASEAEFQKLYAFYQSAANCQARFRRQAYFLYSGSEPLPLAVTSSKVPLWNAHHLELSLLSIMAGQSEPPSMEL